MLYNSRQSRFHLCLLAGLHVEVLVRARGVLEAVRGADAAVVVTRVDVLPLQYDLYDLVLADTGFVSVILLITMRSPSLT